MSENKEPVDSKEEDEDFYMDGPYLVFTAAFHRKRGYCCESGCRHCPFRDKPEAPHAAPR